MTTARIGVPPESLEADMDRELDRLLGVAEWEDRPIEVGRDPIQDGVAAKPPLVATEVAAPRAGAGAAVLELQRPGH